MRVLENKNNMCIIENGEWTYLFSYNTPIAKVNNTIKADKSKSEYGLYFTNKWDYSQTTLKHLYNFIELYTTQHDDKNNPFYYMLDKVNNKKEYLQKQIELGNIKIIDRIEF